jgi:glycosyltransferase involved in cell wall biosynthesis
VNLLIAIPVYNEKNYLDGVIRQVKRYARDILLIDDGSTDGTTELLDAREKQGDICVIHHAKNAGYGQSLIDAFNDAGERGYDWVITMDCDEQHEPRMIPEFIRQIESDCWDIVSGSRYLSPRHNDDLPPGDRRRINQILTHTINERLGLHLTDAFCGFKAHRVSATLRLNLDEAGYAFPMQLWPRAAAAGLRITEMSVRRIYNDPNRQFGGGLDDADNRLRHYRAVLEHEIARSAQVVTPAEPAAASVDAFSCCGSK